MNSYTSILNNENGSVIVMALLALSVLTIIGISSIDISTTELQIVRNEQLYQINFYNAESVINEGLYALQNATSTELGDRSFATFAWLKRLDDDLDMSDTQNWDAANSATSVNLSNAEYAIVEKGVAGGASLDMTATSSMYDYQAVGYSYSDNGTVVIEIGYKKRH